jgi:hypothetical protein
MYVCGNRVYSSLTVNEKETTTIFNALTVINGDKTYTVQRNPITVRRVWFTFSAMINFCFLVNIQLLKFVSFLET